ncbi:MAG: 3-hydroxyacyl-CoA dehydrogenase/enoyl-CoA hydratase family protein [Desulfobacterales bacterium]|nr:3-hydroxyacyl-CoA dehydrogenase/enoyl-CoA hydratase family protein [Desulfobacterales bacterium]
MVRRIEKVAVIGSGIMGGGIAALCAGAGVPTLLLDIVPFDLKEEEKNNPAARNRIVKAGLDGQLKAKPAAFFDKDTEVNLVQIGNLEDDFQKLADCDLIFEVVVENLKIKRSLFERLEKIKKPGAIIASNTSGLPLKEMAEGRTQEFKEHFIIMHFFNPVRYMKLLELVSGPDTKKEVCDFISQWGEKVLGKGIVWAKDTPNFIGNRIGVGLIGEALQILTEDEVTIPEFDAVFGPAFGMPKTAIFALCDLVGLDTINHLADNSYGLLVNDERRGIYQVPQFFKDLVAKGRLGKKTKDKAGFYKSETDMKTWKKITKVIDLKTGEYVEYDRKQTPDIVKKSKGAKTLAEKQQAIFYSDDRLSKIAWKLGARCLAYAANRVPEISDTIVGIDDAMRWGYALEAGPFEVWDNIGVRKSVEKMKADGMNVPENVSKMLAGGNETFYRVHQGKKQYFDFTSNSYKDVIVSKNCIFLADLRASNKVVKSNDSASLIDLGDGVFNIEFHTKMNAINKSMLDFMGEAAEYVMQNGIGLVLGNQAPGIPGAFSAGGDLAFMGGLAKEGKFSEIDAFIKNVHKGIMGLKYAPIPVVAAPYGMTLGGGCEVCLAADKIVAHAELYMGLVEIGAGLVPGGCGMIHLWQRYIESVPQSVTLNDYGAYVIPAFRAVAMAKVSTSAAEARKAGFLRPKDRIIMNKDYLIGEAKKEVLRMVDDGYTPPAKKKYPVMGQEAQGMVWAELFNMKCGSYLTPHMKVIAEKIIYCMTGGEARQGQLVTEEYLCKLEREAFVDLWRTESTQKMAENIMKTGKPLFL